ncbi:MAG TPA: ABC transporter ATP-binding protein [Chloroflexota bacterium]|jgi:peptide/nickel transport system ATP-binding protein
MSESVSPNGQADEVVLRVEELQVFYDTPAGPVRALDGVSFDLHRGERMGLVGESGSGKTTLAVALMRLLRPPGHVVGGRVLLEGRDLRTMSEDELRAVRLKEIALVPQAAMNSLNPVMRVDTQIADGILAHEPGLRRQAIRARVVDALARVGLSPAMGDRYPDQLSGGQRQRAAMAVAVALNPKVIVADEPTSALDVVVQRQVMATLGRIQEGLQAAVILIGHDLGLIAQFADTIGVLYAGRLAEYGPIDRILERPRHPYTRLLLDSLPTLDGKRALVGIPGLPPALLNLPPGCPFAPRCPLAFDRCRDETPELQDVGPDWRVACHLYPEHAELPSFPEGVPTDDGGVVPGPVAGAGATAPGVGSAP